MSDIRGEILHLILGLGKTFRCLFDKDFTSRRVTQAEKHQSGVSVQVDLPVRHFNITDSRSRAFNESKSGLDRLCFNFIGSLFSWQSGSQTSGDQNCASLIHRFRLLFDLFQRFIGIDLR